MRKLIIAVLALTLTVALAGSLSSCNSNNDNNTSIQTVPGETPFIGTNGNWWIGDKDLGVKAEGQQGEPGEDGKPGEPGKTPFIGDNGNWWIGDKDLGVKAEGQQGEPGADGSHGESGKPGETPYIGNNGNWWIGDKDLGVKAEGQQGKPGEAGKPGDTPFIGDNGNWWIGDKDLGVKAEGQQGTPGIDGKPGEAGKPGDTPFIGDNGNWWIGDKDTGVLADPGIDDRKITEGLIFSCQTYKNTAGMIVSDYTGSDTQINIPNYIGFIPVIGISSGVFNNNSKIENVSFSKNMVGIGDNCFSSCSNLKSVDFNDCDIKEISLNAFAGCGNLQTVDLSNTSIEKIGDASFYNCIKLQNVILDNCKLKEIGTSAFYNTNIKEINLPLKNTKLNNEAFKNTKIEKINYENISYYGDYSLNGFETEYIYLNDDVEYVGKYVFNRIPTYIKHNIIPDTWSKTPVIFEDSTEEIKTNCIKTNEYIYSKGLNGITLYQYLGQEKEVEIPKVIDNTNVVKIGYGFGSISPILLNNIETTKCTLKDLEEKYMKYSKVIIPDTVKEIDFYTFVSVNTMVYIPNSVEKMWNYSWNSLYNSTYYLFEDITKIIFDYGYGTTHKSLNFAEWVNECSSNIRYSTGIDFTKVVHDKTDNIYYYNEGKSYSILAYMGIKDEKIVIPSTYNNLPISYIRSYAVASNPFVKDIHISKGIEKVQKYAFKNIKLDMVIIPSSVVTINAHGFSDVCGKFMLGHSIAPLEWDTLWAGNETSTYKIIYGIDTENILRNDNYLYCIDNNNEISLIEYLGKDKIIYISGVIEGKKVTTIKTGFFNSSYMEVYIPSNITKIESKAFVATSSSYSNFYCAQIEKPVLWAEDWYYNESQNSSNGYVHKNWSSNVYNGDVKKFDVYNYSIENDEVVLISCVNERDFLYIPNVIDGKKVTTIKSGFCNSSNRKVYIPSNITKIESKAFVTTSSSYSNFYCAQTEKPVLWAEDWYYNEYDNSTNSYVHKNWSSNIYNDVKYNKYFYYIEKGNNITLIKCLCDGNIYIPRSINGKIVTEIESDFYLSRYTTNIYIPKTVEKIKSRAFINNNYNYFNFYYEHKAKVEFESNYYYNSYYDSSTKYVKHNWNYTLDY